MDEHRKGDRENFVIKKRDRGRDNNYSTISYNDINN